MLTEGTFFCIIKETSVKSLICSSLQTGKRAKGKQMNAGQTNEKKERKRQ